MPVKVQFPDGEREVPSHTVEIKSREIGGTGTSSFYEEPDEDPEWKFLHSFGNRWDAIARYK